MASVNETESNGAKKEKKTVFSLNLRVFFFLTQSKRLQLLQEGLALSEVIVYVGFAIRLDLYALMRYGLMASKFPLGLIQITGPWACRKSLEHEGFEPVLHQILDSTQPSPKL